MSDNPFSDTLYRVPSDDDLTNTKILTCPTTVSVPLIQSLAPAPTSAWSPSTASSTAEDSPSPASTTPSTPPPPSPLAWSAADLEYLLTILYPFSTHALTLSTHLVHPRDPFSPVQIECVYTTKCPPAPIPVPASAYDRTAPIGTGRPKTNPTTHYLLASATGPTLPEARKALAQAMLSTAGRPLVLGCIAGYYALLADIHTLPTASLLSLARGIDLMEGVSETEWLDRREQLRAARIDSGWDVEVRLEAWLLEGGRGALVGWGGVVGRVGMLGIREREEVRGTYGGVVGFLGGLEGVW